MSKNINVNPDRYKVAGRERQSEHVVHQHEKQSISHGHRSEPRAYPSAPTAGREKGTRNRTARQR